MSTRKLTLDQPPKYGDVLRSDTRTGTPIVMVIRSRYDLSSPGFEAIILTGARLHEIGLFSYINWEVIEE